MTEQILPAPTLQTLFVSRETSKCPLLTDMIRLGHNLQNMGLTDEETGILRLDYGKRLLISAKNTDLKKVTQSDIVEIPDLALILYGAAMKLYLFGAIFVHLALGFRLPGPWDAATFVAGLLGFAALVGVTESVMARLRLTRVPQMLVGASVLSVFALVLLLR